MTDFVSRRQPGMQLVLPKSKRNKYVLSALCLWFALAAVLFIWSGVQNAQFAAQLHVSKGALRSVLVAAPEKIKAAKDAGDTTSLAATLREISATLSQRVQELPANPAVLGLRIGADAEHTTREQLKVAADACAASLRELADFIAYQSSLGRDLQGLSLKDATGYDATIELANSWRDIIQKVQTESKPQSLTEVTATLLQKMAITETVIRDMAELYKNNDTDGFTAKRSQLAASIGEFKQIGDTVAGIGVQLDAKLANAVTKLQQKL